MENFIKAITKKAGAAVLKKFGKIGVAYTKKHANDVVTEADLLSNKILVDAIKKKYPAHGIVSEEQGERQAGAEYVWYIDPLDGSKNFASGIPLFVIMVGLARKGRLELATIFDPLRHELYFAKRGQGAYLNGKKIHCSDTRQWAYSAGCVSTNVTNENVNFLKNLSGEAARQHLWLNAFSSAGLCSAYVAVGRVDWYAGTRGADVWDRAAAALILSEAGGRVSNAKGQPWTLADRELITSNKHLHKRLLQIIQSKHE